MARLMAAALLLTAAFGCGGVNFNSPGSPGTNNASGTPSGNGNGSLPAEGQREEVFKVSSKTGPVDVIWIIDNSSSMTAEIQHVRDNFKNFADFAARNQVNARIALLGKNSSAPFEYKGTPLQPIDMSAELKALGHIQIDYPVLSETPLIAATGALCPSVSTPALCRDYQNWAPEEELLPTRLAGSLNTFWRSGSRKVYVFVTDDDSDMDHTQFIRVHNQVFPAEQPVVFGFIALDTKTLSPCMASPSTEYRDLIAATGGERYNICDKDWSPHFSKLAANVVSLGSRRAVLSRTPSGIVSVRLDGVTLQPNQYSLNGNTLEVSASLLTVKDLYELRITYY